MPQLQPRSIIASVSIGPSLGAALSNSPRGRQRTPIASSGWWARLALLPLVFGYALLLPAPVSYFCLPLSCWTLAAVNLLLGRRSEEQRGEAVLNAAVGVVFLSGTIAWLVTGSVGWTLLWTFLIPPGAALVGFVVVGIVVGVRNSK